MARRGMVAAGLLLLVAGCGGSLPRPAAGIASSPPSAAGPSITVAPDTNLLAGQRVSVTLRQFPAHVTVQIWECAAPPASGRRGCAGGSSIVYTDSHGDAQTALVVTVRAAEPGGQTYVRCDQQCVLAAGVIKPSPDVLPENITTPLAFSPVQTETLANASLLDLTLGEHEPGVGAGERAVRGTCARVARTVDGGRHWQPLPDPPAQAMTDTTADCFPACVSHIRFATGSLGYLYGPDLLTTHDGGLSWQHASGPNVDQLEVLDHAVYRSAWTHSGCPGPCDISVQRAAIGAADWHPVINPVDTPDRGGPPQLVGTDSILLAGAYGSLAGPVSARAKLYRSTDGGATWQKLDDPCPNSRPDEVVLTALATAPGGFVAGLCQQHSNPSTGTLITSEDGGSTWSTPTPLPSGTIDMLAAASPQRLAVATAPVSGGGSFQAKLFVSTDGGRHWRTARIDPQQIEQSVPAWLGFETAQVGRWIGDPHGIWTTYDGGQHWTRWAFH